MRTRSTLFAFLILALTVLAVGCGRSAAPTDQSQTPDETSMPSSGAIADEPAPADNAASAIVAEIDGRPVTEEDFHAARDALLSQYETAYEEQGKNLADSLQGASGYVLSLEIENQTLEQIIMQFIVEAEVAARGLTVDDATIDAEYRKQMDEFLSTRGITEDQLADILAAQNYDFGQFKQDARRSVELQLTAQAVKEAVAGDVGLPQTEEYETARQAILDDRFNAWYAERYKETEVVVYNPYIHAVRERDASIERGIEAFENLMMQEETANPYILYILGGLYEVQRNELLDQIAAIEGGAAAPEGTDVDSLQLQADYLGQKALNRLHRARDWLASVGVTDSSVEQHISSLEETIVYDPSFTSP